MQNFSDPIFDPLNYKFGVFYFNKKDHRSIVPKRNKMLGWTLNFAKPGTYLFLAVLMLIVILAR